MQNLNRLNSTSFDKTKSLALVVFTCIAIFVAGLGWVFASPIGGSPDDDYHMGSIWCPRPVGESCATELINDVEHIEVPVAVAAGATCHAFHSDQSAIHCPRDINTDEKMLSLRYDDGNYPTGYYLFQHQFIQDDVGKSIIIMRIINLTIAVVLLGVLGILLKPEERAPFLLAMVVTWIPMGFYFITSMNPSSWSITGVYVYMVAMYSAATSKDWRKWALIAVGILGAILCFTSRRDASFYLFVIAVAFIFAVKWTKENYPQGIVIAVIGLLGVYAMAQGGQAKYATESVDTGQFTLTHAIRIILDLPRYFAGMYGVTYGPGWFDTPLEGPVTFIAMFVASGIFMLSLRSGSWRKWLAAGTICGAMCGIPVVFLLKGIFATLGEYQPRYILPLLPVLLFVLLVVGRRSPRIIDLPQLLIVGFSITLIHSLALHTVLLRYISGINGEEPLNLNNNVEWWWNISISPMSLWMVASVAFACAIACSMFVIYRNSIVCSVEAHSVTDVPEESELVPDDDAVLVTESMSMAK